MIMTTINIENIIYLDHSGKDFENPIIIDSDSEENSFENPIIIDVDDEQIDDNGSENNYNFDDEIFSLFKTYETKEEMLTDIKTTTIIENKSSSSSSSTVVENKQSSVTSSTIIRSKSTVSKISVSVKYYSSVQLRDKSNWSKKENKYYFCGEPYFEVKNSNIPEAGQGLFSLKEFKMNRKRKKHFTKSNNSIFYYEGRTIAYKKNNLKYNYDEFKKLNKINRDITDEEFYLWETSPDGNCIMEINEKNTIKIIDGNIDNFNGTRFINDSMGRNKGNLAINPNGGFYLIKSIKVGDEFLFQYSPRNTYWKDRTEEKIKFGNSSKGIDTTTKKILAKKKRLKSFPDIPISFKINDSIRKNSFVKAPWLDGKDKKFNGLYNGHIVDVNKKKKTCSILFEDNCIDKNVKFSNITLVKKSCPYCSNIEFVNKITYDQHTKKCRETFLKE